MNVSLSVVRCRSALVYLENIVVFSHSEVEHVYMYHVTHVFTLSRHPGATLNLRQFNLFINRAEYMIQVYPQRRSEAAKHTMDANKKPNVSQNVTELTLLHRRCKLVKRLVQSFASLELPFTSILQKAQPFNFY